ncbi:hypothetical protein PIB30_012530 [Stylosanthes scabra]|uniref:Uncharacterized protein n=1 Tax=Stylosanthes scabra TaxID=79078 RepID=A0ABU6V4F0_9FABA|nr:hypothetical protein [Stylosanthes scabra]
MTEMNHMSLNGRNLFVGKTRNRSDNKTPMVNASPRNVAKKDIEKNKFDKSENESSKRTVTWSYGEKECDENNLSLLEDVGVELEGAMDLNGYLTTNESVCSSEVGIGEVVKEASHDKQILSKRKEKEANPMERDSS